ncbi:tRNA (guanosine(46)-N7)-methyltransferase TrmB [Mycoplasma sp. CSL10137]|uniref:tRNA (guanosine(46)-N7)-methyltransferase TrmB n=1 Tax=unclassified Mycoplasma TaxID=2683645 RepID=UPI00197BFA99|nr:MULTISPECIES: tRNA (guanosine(46)-N7)-methyltransferase TrmB [unclassified Mycoplasma]MBN4083326.1 tRNA (guanosine(46)-N7)-methyltransferase TrmB [Mycoplasma sp. CSL10137]MBN4084371.1 tRNA (guanosine(46)-N7)-methyltransferase TrmB [Mycoplasma sp. CSL10166]MBU4692857.1 tRNA (guanosine(46)-N7)-methyltransferase TrmB [Mycoplasma sp. CSL7491-lung]
MRLRHDNTAQDKLNNSEFYLNKFPVQLYPNDVVEIGAGKGEMISQLALNNPEIRFFAIEKYPTVANKILNKINDLKLTNLFVITENADNLSEIFEGNVDKIWLTFSDPWPKNSHERRRLTYKKYLSLYEKLLTKSGQLHLKTDNDGFFDYSTESLKENGWEIVDSTTDLHNSKYNKNNYKTGYEIKWSSKGKNINYLFARKK